MMKFGLLSILLLLVLLIGFYQGYSNDSTTSTVVQPETEPSLEETIESEVTTSEIEESEEEPEEESIKERVTQVVEDALGLFVEDDLHVTAIGDSLTQGVGDTNDEGGYVEIIENTLKENLNEKEVTVNNFGKRGNRSDQLLKRLDQPEIVSSIEKSDMVLITIGANDIMAIVKDQFLDLDYDDFAGEKEPYEARLNEIIQTIKSKNSDAEIFLIGLYNPFEKPFSHIPELQQILRDWNEIGKRVAEEEENMTFIPMEEIFSHREEVYAEDHFHPNKKGYKLMAERVISYVRPFLETEEE